MDLLLRCERLVSRIQQLSKKIWTALNRYQRWKSALKKLLRRASQSQSQACSAARELRLFEDQLLEFDRECHAIEKDNPVKAEQIKADLGRIKDLITEWGTQANVDAEDGGGAK